MSFQARVDVDVVFHESSGSTFAVGSVDDHQFVEPAGCETLTGSVTSEAATLASSVGTLSTLAIKNTGSSVLRIAGVIDIAAGRVAVLPVTSAVTVEAPSGSGQYAAIWVG
jgi:hypothetical protein